MKHLWSRMFVMLTDVRYMKVLLEFGTEILHLSVVFIYDVCNAEG
jgi:hypothetical protein